MRKTCSFYIYFTALEYWLVLNRFCFSSLMGGVRFGSGSFTCDLVGIQVLNQSAIISIKTGSGTASLSKPLVILVTT